MKNLFEKDKSAEISRRADEIKNAIESCYINKQGEISELQKEINRFNNFSRYEYFRLHNTSCAERINELYHKYKNFLDVTEENFCTGFSGNLGERVYELAMADLLHKGAKFVFQKRLESQGLPTLKCGIMIRYIELSALLEILA